MTEISLRVIAMDVQATRDPRWAGLYDVYNKGGSIIIVDAKVSEVAHLEAAIAKATGGNND